jgi:hypothetical protein
LAHIANLPRRKNKLANFIFVYKLFFEKAGPLFLVKRNQNPSMLPHQRQELCVKGPAVEKLSVALEADSILLKHVGKIVVV